MKVFIFICTQTTLGFASISGHFRPPAEGESSALSLSRLGQSLGPGLKAINLLRKWIFTFYISFIRWLSSIIQVSAAIIRRMWWLH